MPNVLLTPYECRTGRLPRVCAKCGEPAGDGVPLPALTPVTYVLFNAFVLACPPVFIVVAAVLFRRRTFVLPLCPPHRADWVWRDRLTMRTYVGVVCGVYLVAPALGYLLWDGVEDEVAAIAGLLVYFHVWVAWVIPVAVMWTRTVRIRTVKPEGIRLAAAHPAFVAALRDDRARDPEPARLRWGGDERDDYDDRAE